MAVMEYNDEQPDRGATPVPFQLRLGSPKTCRQTMSRIIREHAKGTIDGTTMRSLVWALGQILAYWRFERDGEIETRLARLEQIADAMLQGQGGKP